MNRSDVMRAAREAGVHALEASDALAPFLERFAALVRAKVLEDAAQVCEGRARDHEEYAASDDGDERSLVYAKHVRRCATAIRGMKSDSGHSAAADAGASTAPLPDPQLCKFYAVKTWPELVAAMERHINKLQAKLPATPSLAPQRVREG